MEINSKTKLYCIFGNPVSHSLSPILHNTAFQCLKLNSIYLAFAPDNIKEAITSVKTLHISGASITIPFKVDAMNFIDEIDPLAEKIGSINTIVNHNGKLKGYNTDGTGALNALKKSKILIENSKVLVLGNGGSARAIAFTLLEKNAEVTIAGRNINKISELTSDLKKFSDKVSGILLEDLNNADMNKFNIIINTTPIGMHPDIEKIPINEKLINKNHIVFDIVYSPDMTKLLKEANSRGCKIVRGIDMLIYQGIEQFRLWTHEEPPYMDIHEALSKKLI